MLKKEKPKIKPLFSKRNNEFKLHEWIINSFPEGYQDMIYLEPYISSGAILFNKETSKEEVINDSDEEITNLLRVIRDQKSEFLRKINRKVRNSNTELVKAIMAFTKYNKYTYDINDKINLASKRLDGVYILNCNSSHALKTFNYESSFVYINPPLLDENNHESVDEHIEMSNILKSFKGKVMIKTNPTKLYSRIYKEWKLTYAKNSDKNDALWTNY